MNERRLHNAAVRRYPIGRYGRDSLPYRFAVTDPRQRVRRLMGRMQKNALARFYGYLVRLGWH